MTNWKVFARYEDFSDDRLIVAAAFTDWQGNRSFIQAPLAMKQYDSRSLIEDKDVDLARDMDGRAFLQAMLDAAWELGLRPEGYENHTNELKAVRYHLEDMRTLAKVNK